MGQVYQGGKSKKNTGGESIIMTPIQQSGIVNPNIFIQNDQMSPWVPKLTPPKVNIDLDLKGFSKYYWPKIQGVTQLLQYRSKIDYEVNIHSQKIISPAALKENNKKITIGKILNKHEREKLQFEIYSKSTNINTDIY